MDNEIKGILISCIDRRLIDETVVFMNELGHTNNYYHLTLAGCGLNVPAIGQPDNEYVSYLKSQIDVILSISGGHLDFICILEHRDCKAYEGKYPHLATRPDDEFTTHKGYADNLKERVVQWTKIDPDKVSTHIMRKPAKDLLAEKL